MKNKIEQLKKRIQILRIQIQIALFKKKLTVPNLKAPLKIIIHHGGGWFDFKVVDNYHKQKWGFKSSLGFYAGYTYFIERNGKVFQARSDFEEGAHTKGHNRRSIGICLMGNGVEQSFTKEQGAALRSLLLEKRNEYNIPKSEVYGHRDFSDTICPSDILYNEILKYKRSNGS